MALLAMQKDLKRRFDNYREWVNMDYEEKNEVYELLEAEDLEMLMDYVDWVSQYD